MIDRHNDLPEMIQGGAGGDLEKIDPDKTLSIDTDIPRLEQGLVGGQFFAAYVASSYTEKGGAKVALEQIDIINRFTERSPSLETARVRIGLRGRPDYLLARSTPDDRVVYPLEMKPTQRST
jgi:membrane dipeptidase